MLKKLDEKAQTSQMILFLFIMLISMFIFGDPVRRVAIAEAMNSALFPTLGFNGSYVLLTVFLSGCLVTLLSSFFTNLFTDWVAVGRSQEKSRAFQAEMRKARMENDTAKVNKLMKHQTTLMKEQQEASSGMMKPMIFLFLFIAPIFIWLTYFLSQIPYFYFSVPWAGTVIVTGRAIGIMSNWFLMYMVFTMVIGQVVRAGFKYLTWNMKGVGQPKDQRS